MLWTEEEIEILTKMYKAGEKGKDIAAKLKGRTRGSVVAKIKKLGITRDVEVQKGRPSKYVERKVQIPDDAFKDNLKIHQLEKHHCRFPKGSSDYVFCGRERRTGEAYCQEHYLLSRKVQRRR